MTDTAPTPQTDRLLHALRAFLVTFRKISKRVKRESLTLSTDAHSHKVPVCFSDALRPLSAHERLSEKISLDIFEKDLQNLLDAMRAHSLVQMAPDPVANPPITLTLWTNRSHMIPRGQIRLNTQPFLWNAGDPHRWLVEALSRLQDLERVDRLFPDLPVKEWGFFRASSLSNTRSFGFACGHSAGHAALRMALLDLIPVLPLGMKTLEEMQTSGHLITAGSSPDNAPDWREEAQRLAQRTGVTLWENAEGFDRHRIQHKPLF